MKRTGRYIATFVLFTTVLLWHSSYFLIDLEASRVYFLTHGFILYDFIYTPLMFPFMWWLGKQYDKARYYSERDILTGVYNRRYVLGIFDKFAALTNRNGMKLSVSVIDVDNFKSINDVHGHLVGDKVLQHISGVLVTSTRKSDIVSRWGGDEFLVIAQHQELTGVDTLNQRLRQNISDNMKDFEITVSVGTVVFPDNGERLDELIKKADRQMYELKWNLKQI